MVIGSVISVFCKGAIHQLFGSIQGKQLGALGVIPASALGIASPLCMYGTIPLAASFSAGGMADNWLAAFMMSSILLNPQLIIYSAALGPAALTIRILSSFLCGAVAGLLVRRFFREKRFFNFAGFSGPANRDTDPNPILRLLKNIGRNAKATGPATKITKLGALKIVLGAKHFALYLVFVALFSLATGMLVDLVLPI